MSSRTFFTGLKEAERYARSRPFFHPLAVDRARAALGILEGISYAIDIGCGTGQSSVALLPIANRVVGIDLSRNMLAHAERSARVHYAQARAEAMPFKSGSVLLITTALAFHWFDRHRFLGEAWRVIQGEGCLFAYDNGFRGVMRENPAFSDWTRDSYLKRYPTPPRDTKPLTSEEAVRFGFLLIGEDTFENEVAMTPEELVAYLTTQSNVIAAVDGGGETLDVAQTWLLDQVRPFFEAAQATFLFGTRAWYLRKLAAR